MSFAFNAMAHDHIYATVEPGAYQLRLPSHYRFDLRQMIDTHIPMITLLDETIPEKLFAAFHPTEEETRKGMLRLSIEQGFDSKVLKAAYDVILLTMKTNSDVFEDFCSNLHSKPQGYAVRKCFAAVKNVEPSLREEAAQAILAFYHQRVYDLIKAYAEEEFKKERGEL